MKTVLYFLAGALAIAAFFALLGLLVWGLERGDNIAAQKRSDAVARANSACLPDKPTKLVFHGPSWSMGPYWEVTCPDHSVRVVIVQ
jgi:hypothetical protein